MIESKEKVMKVKNIYEKIWLELEKVNAVGTGKTRDGRLGLVISLSCDDPATKEIFPGEIEGVPIEFKITGETDAL